MEFDDILRKYVGEFGTYQMLFMLFASSIALNDVMNDLDYNFTAAQPRFWCSDANITHLIDGNFTQEELIQLVSPQKIVDNTYDSCLMYDRNYTAMSVDDARQLLNSHGNITSATKHCTKWEYSKEQFTSTIVTEWDLVCDKEWMIATSQAVYMSGRFTIFIGGWLADKFGRKWLSLSMMILHFVSRAAAGLAVNYYMFIVVRFFQSMCSVNWYSAVFVIGVEMVGPKWRIFAGQAVSLFYAIGYMILAGMAYFIRDWRQLTLLILLYGVPYILHFCFLPESVRWLISRHKTKKAKRLLIQMAKINRKQIPDESTFQNEILPPEQFTPEKESETKQSTGYCDLFKRWHLIKITSVLVFHWFSIIVIYYGIIYYLPKLGGNIYVSTVISGALEIPALIFVQISADTKLGRKHTTSITFIFSGVAFFAIMAVPIGMDWLTITLALAGKFAISCTFSLIYVYTSELFPTNLRATGLSFCSTWSRFGGIVAPYLVLMGKVSVYIPPFLLGTLAILSGITAFILPETRGKKLPENLTQVEQLGRESHHSIQSKEGETLPATKEQCELMIKASNV